MVKEYEDNIIQPPIQFRDNYKPIPLPRNKNNIIQPPVEFRDDFKKPVPLPRTNIKQKDTALKDYTKSFENSIKNEQDPLVQLQSTRLAIKNNLKNQ